MVAPRLVHKVDWVRVVVLVAAKTLLETGDTTEVLALHVLGHATKVEEGAAA